MKIIGSKGIAKRERDVVVGYDTDGNEVTLRVQAIRLGLVDDIEEEIPYPEPPLGAVKRDRRGMVLKDDSGAPVRERLDDDPKYLVERERVRTLRGVAAIYYSILPGQVEFEAEKKDWPDRTSFFKAIHEEMDQAGIKQGALTTLMLAVNELAQVGQDEVENAKSVIRGKDEKGNPTEPSPTGA